MAVSETSERLTHRSKTKDNSNNGEKTMTTNNTLAVEMENRESSPETSSSWWKRSMNAALKGGASGSIAMVLQVVLLMWLRTTVNYQYKHGVGTVTAFSLLYNEGGILRFYRGASVALLTGPLSRFGDTAANEGIRELLGGRSSNANSNHKNNNSRFQLPVWAMTLTASVVASLWRIMITPLDTIKTTLQVSSGPGSGWETISTKIGHHGFLVLWDGALGNSLATLVGHYPWFIVHNFLEARLPKPEVPPESDDPRDPAGHKYKRSKLLRRAFIGFCASLASDCVSNGIRVVKTYRQTSAVQITYGEALSELFQKNGLAFMVRGLGLKILSNGLGGILFAVLWKMILERLNQTSKNATNSKNESGDDTKQQQGDVETNAHAQTERSGSGSGSGDNKPKQS